MSEAVNKNVRGGKAYKRGKTRRAKATKPDFTLDVENGEGFYGVVQKMSGEKLVEVLTNDGTVIQVRIPGRMYKRQWVKVGFTVLINTEHEIVKIIRETDKEAKDANYMMQKAGGEEDIFGQQDDSEEDDDVYDKLDKLKVSDKTKEMLSRKEKEKQRDISRRGGRQFSEPSEMSKATSEDSESDIDSDDIDEI